MQTVNILEERVLYLQYINRAIIEHSAFSGVTIETIRISISASFTEYSFLNVKRLTRIYVVDYIWKEEFYLPPQVGKFPTNSNLNIYLVDQSISASQMNYVAYSKLAVGAFQHTNFRMVSISSSISILPPFLFDDCKFTASIYLNAPIEEISDYAFRDCVILSSILTMYDPSKRYLFYNGVFNLTGIKRIGKSAFANVNSIRTIILSGLTISDLSFTLPSLTNVTFVVHPNNVLVVDGAVPFTNCENLQSINIPRDSTCLSLANNDFSKLFADTNIVNNNWVFAGCVEDPLFQFNDTNHKFLVSYTDNPVSIEIPSSVVYIHKRAFSSSRVQVISFSSTSVLIDIDRDAFEGSQVHMLTLPKSLRSIPAYFLQDVSTIVTVKLLHRIVEIPEGAFKGCINLQSIQISNDFLLEDKELDVSKTSIQRIVGPAFVGFSFTKLGLQLEGTNVVEFGFKNRTELLNIEFPADLSSFPNEVLLDCTKLISIKIGYNVIYTNETLDLSLTEVSEIGTLAFPLSTVRTIILPKGSITFSDRAFSNFHQLDTIIFQTLGSNVSFNGHPFSGCILLSNVTLPENSIYPSNLNFHELFKGSGVESKDWDSFGAIKVDGNSNSESSTLTTGAIVGIVIAAILVLLTIVIGVFWNWKSISGNSLKDVDEVHEDI